MSTWYEFLRLKINIYLFAGYIQQAAAIIYTMMATVWCITTYHHSLPILSLQYQALPSPNQRVACALLSVQGGVQALRSAGEGRDSHWCCVCVTKQKRPQNYNFDHYSGSRVWYIFIRSAIYYEARRYGQSDNRRKMVRLLVLGFALSTNTKPKQHKIRSLKKSFLQLRPYIYIWMGSRGRYGEVIFK